MSRTQRLFDLLQLLRQHRFPVSGSDLADTLDVSLRTLYRDIATLKSQGADIDGEPGLGYVLRPGFMLPPLMFSPEEIEALVLGFRWVAKKTDGDLQDAAKAALSKISSVLPFELRNQLELSSLMIGPGNVIAADDKDLSLIRKAIRMERKLNISYQDEKKKPSSRVIWPIGMGFFDQVRIVIGWCELRQDFRHFRTDRITALEPMDERYPEHHARLLSQWRALNNIPPQ